jgi:RsiW-degrading membrane proteinase PrsW (M82 family)
VLEAEGYPLLEAAARKDLVKTQQAAKWLADAVVICELWRLVVVLSLLVVSSRAYMWSINTFTKTKPHI